MTATIQLTPTLSPRLRLVRDPLQVGQPATMKRRREAWLEWDF